MEQSKIKGKKVFISYGQKDAQQLAFQLERDLIKLGHTVWLDKSQMRSGESWEQQIEEGIMNAEIFIALLSPWAVRRPDGVCLDEISFARYNNRKIIPTMVIQCKPPLGIYRLDWIDFQNWKNENQYNFAFNRLLNALQKKEVVDGYYSQIFSQLDDPLDFGREIAKYMHDFIGREWLIKDLNEWIEKEDNRVFLITGDPGIGKSAIIAYIIETHPQVIAYHFCRNDLPDTLQAIRFVKSIAAQLVTQLPNYREVLNAIRLEDLIAIGDPNVIFRRIIIEPLESEEPDSPLLIVVDGLDEGLSEKEPNIISVLRNRLDELPNWVRLVLSSRKNPEILDLFNEFRLHVIDASRSENLQDVNSYLEMKLMETEIACRLKESAVNAKEFAKIIAQKGGGNFLYVINAIKAVKDGLMDPSDPRAFPPGIVGWYKIFFGRLFPEGQGYKEFRQILEVIIAAREPLTAKQIGNFLKCSTFEIRKNLQKLASFFPESNNCYQAYHKSLIDWLLGEAKSKQDLTYQIDIESGHRCIVEHLLQSYQEGNIDRYLLKHLPQHLLVLQRWETLDAILTDLAFIKEKCSEGMLRDLLYDYDSIEVSFPKTKRTNYTHFRKLLRLAVRLSSVDIYSYHDQLIPHLIARFYDIENPLINDILQKAGYYINAPWLKALVPCLKSPNDVILLQWQAYDDLELARIHVDENGKHFLSIDIQGRIKYWELYTGRQLPENEGEKIFKDKPIDLISKKGLIDRWTYKIPLNFLTDVKYATEGDKFELTTSDKSLIFYLRTTLGISEAQHWVPGIHSNLYSIFIAEYSKNKHLLFELDEHIDLGNLAYTAGMKGRIKLDIITSLLLSSDDNFLLTGCASGKIIIWDLAKLKERFDKQSKEEEKKSIVFLEKHKEEIYGLSQELSEIGKKEINVSNSSIVTLALTKDDQIIFGTTDGKIGITRDNIKCLNEIEISEIKFPINLGGLVSTIALYPEGDYALCVNKDGLITKWETSTGRLIWKFEQEYHNGKDLSFFKTFISSDYSVAVLEFADLDYGGGIGLMGIDLQTMKWRLIIDPDANYLEIIDPLIEPGTSTRTSLSKEKVARLLEKEMNSILKNNYGDIFNKTLDITKGKLNQSKILTEIALDNKQMLNIVDNKKNLIARFLFEEPLDKTVISSNGSIIACASLYGDLYFLELKFPET